MSYQFTADLTKSLKSLESEGLYKCERPLSTAQGAVIGVTDAAGQQRDVINLCANNYLGLADHPQLIKAAKSALDHHGYGMASVRFICGTQDLHRQLEQALATFLDKDDAILFASCFDANGGLFEPLLDENDAIISDSLNHASIIDGIRLCIARRYRYANNDMTALEDRLKQARADGARHIMIATDGVFSMDGSMANLADVTRLAQAFDALLMVDDCHATGFVGPGGRGTAAHFGVDVDVLTGTLGKALGGAIGGYAAGPQPVIDMLRQRSRPYLFSNSLPPSVVAAGLAALDLVAGSDALRMRLFENAVYWRQGLETLGFRLLPGTHPIIPVMLGDATLSQKMAERLFDLGVLAPGFFFPVVPQGQARIRTQMSAALTKSDLDRALAAFATAGRELGVIT